MSLTDSMLLASIQQYIAERQQKVVTTSMKHMSNGMGDTFFILQGSKLQPIRFLRLNLTYLRLEKQE